MTPEIHLATAINPALSVLPERMDSIPAKAMLLAIAMQESGLRHRAQVGGPARGFYQFEPIGVSGVQQHHATSEFSAGVNHTFLYSPNDVYSAIEHNDALAAAYARLLLWSLPDALPGGRMDMDEGWRIYVKAWRPGKPHPERWASNWRAAWAGL
jgi:hypothetical protein